MEEKILNILISMQSDICEMKQDIKQLNQRMDRLEVKVDDIDKKHDKNYIELRNQRQIDSNNIAKILSIQTEMLKRQDRMSA